MRLFDNAMLAVILQRCNDDNKMLFIFFLNICYIDFRAGVIQTEASVLPR